MAEWHRIITSPYTGSMSMSGSFNVDGDSTITGNVTINGTASVSNLIVKQIGYSSGSNQLGDAANDTQTIYGTVVIPTGSLTVTGSVNITGTSVAAVGTARSTNIVPILSASANNDTLVGLDINPIFSTGSFTGVTTVGLRAVNNQNTSATATIGGIQAINNLVVTSSGITSYSPQFILSAPSYRGDTLTSFTSNIILGAAFTSGGSINADYGTFTISNVSPYRSTNYMTIGAFGSFNIANSSVSMTGADGTFSVSNGNFRGADRKSVV